MRRRVGQQYEQSRTSWACVMLTRIGLPGTATPDERRMRVLLSICAAYTSTM
jgi:hypothetical protein